jgi:hypothetical protein
MACLIKGDVAQVGIKVHERTGGPANNGTIRIRATWGIDPRLWVLAFAVEEGREDGMFHAGVCVYRVKVKDWVQIIHWIVGACMFRNEPLDDLVSLDEKMNWLHYEDVLYIPYQGAKDLVDWDSIVAEPSIGNTNDTFPLTCRNEGRCGRNEGSEKKVTHRRWRC